MSVRDRIIMLVVLTLVALASIGGYAILQSHWNATEVKVVTEGVVPSALATADMVAQLKDVQISTMAVVTSPDANLARQANDKLSAQKNVLQQSLELQLRQASSDTQRGLVEQAMESLANYFAAIDDTAKLKLAGQQTLAEANLFATVGQYQSELEVIVETLRIEKNRTKDSAIDALNRSLTQTVSAISVVSLAAILGLSFLGLLLYRQVILPITHMQEMMSEIATHQDFTHRLPVGSNDEIGRSIVAFNTMIEKIQESSAQLKQKTNDIQTMLQNMPQGILTIAEGNRVHPEYSAFLETIFECTDIAGRDVMELVFANTNLGADSLAQIEAAGGACLGEDVMNFEFNEHLLVGEIEKTMADGRIKVLDLNWSPITDDANITVRLLLCVRDVTELRKLAAEANEQKRELEIIGEILAVSQEKFHEFVASALKFIDENELAIRACPKSQPDAIAKLFRNMHTIKGNARTYGLRHLTNIVHGAEQTYAELRKDRPSIAWDQALLLDELAGVRAAVERYAKVNDVSLGRKGPGRRGNVDRYLMVEREQIRKTLHRLETVNTSNLHELIATRDAVRNVLRRLGTEPISQVLAGVFDSTPALAKELGKIPPVVIVEDNGYFVHTQVSGMLKNVFMHLVRNSVDHGLERPDERLAQGKLAAGTLQLQMGVANGMLEIMLSDDGRGLALRRIRQIAEDKGLIAAGEPLSDEEIARLIFRAGFSTAEKVTEVSGRGVGMDAVQDFVKRENGRIDIVFTDQAVGAEFRQFETIVYLPESCAVFAEEGEIDDDLEVAEADDQAVDAGDLRAVS